MFGKYSQSVKIGFTAALVISACVVDSVTIAYDGSVMGSVNVMPSYNNYFEITTATKAVNSTATSLGAILIALFAGFIVDKFGRRYSVLASALFNILGAVITASAQNLAMFIAGRMVVGLGMGLAQTAAGIYVAETTPPKIRAFALGLYYTCWAVGGILATGISFGVSCYQDFSLLLLLLLSHACEKQNLTIS
jgi:MFS family permease